MSSINKCAEWTSNKTGLLEIITSWPTLLCLELEGSSATQIWKAETTITWLWKRPLSALETVLVQNTVRSYIYSGAKLRINKSLLKAELEDIFFNLQLWPLISLQPLDQNQCLVPHLKDLLRICLEKKALRAKKSLTFFESDARNGWRGKKLGLKVYWKQGSTKS